MQFCVIAVVLQRLLISKATFILPIKCEKWHFLSIMSRPTHFFYRYFRYSRWFEFSLCLESQVIWSLTSKWLF